MKRYFVTVSGGGGVATPHRPTGEAPQAVRRQREQRENVNKSFYCGFHGKNRQGRASRCGIGYFELFQWALGNRTCPCLSGTCLGVIRVSV